MTYKGLFKSDIDRLKRASSAKTGKRFASFFIDFIIVVALSFLVFLAARPIVESTSVYRDASKTVKREISYYNDLVAEAQIVEFIDSERTTRKSYDILVIENVNRAIYQSFLEFGNDQEPRFVIDEGSKVTKYGRANLQTDNIAYFYTTYVPENGHFLDYDGRTPLEYLYYLYEGAFYVNKTMFTFDEKIGVPTLNTRAAYSLYHYLYIDEDDSDGQQGKAYYDVYYNAYSSMLERAENILIRSEPYQSNHYFVYRKNIETQARLMNVGLMLSIVCGYLIGILAPKLFFKDEKTFGRLLVGLGTVTVKEEIETTSRQTTLCKALLGGTGFMTCSLILYMFPPFLGVFDTMLYPLMVIGSFRLSFLVLILLISLVAVVNNVFSFFNHYRQSLIEFLCKTYLVDTHYLDDSDLDDQYEGKPI